MNLRDRFDARQLPVLQPNTAATIAVVATGLTVLLLIIGSLLAVWLYSGLSSQPLFVPWELVGPALVEAAVTALIAIGLHRRSRLAYLGAVVVHARTLLVWASFLLSEEAVIVNGGTLIWVPIAAVALISLAVAYPVFWQSRQQQEL